MDPYQLTASVTALANAMARSFTEEELTLMASILVQLGDILVTIVSRNAMLSEKTEGKC